MTVHLSDEEWETLVKEHPDLGNLAPPATDKDERPDDSEKAPAPAPDSGDDARRRRAQGARDVSGLAKLTSTSTLRLLQGRGGGTFAGTMLGAFVGFPVAFNLIHGGPAGIWAWLKAKFTNSVGPAPASPKGGGPGSSSSGVNGGSNASGGPPGTPSTPPTPGLGAFYQWAP